MPKGRLDLAKYTAEETNTNRLSYGMALKGPRDFFFYVGSAEERVAWMAAFAELCAGGSRASLSHNTEEIEPEQDDEGEDAAAPEDA